ncbi:hypothetical protein BJY01DRAFT_158568 [Aspergillus pseudoustus]|uniref:Uncharacterized protein n=1 Tax=Aspergillus pseudoustus TaxID=1810923 RepID=A0ABR4KXV6_9EURO
MQHIPFTFLLSISPNLTPLIYPIFSPASHTTNHTIKRLSHSIPVRPSQDTKLSRKKTRATPKFSSRLPYNPPQPAKVPIHPPKGREALRVRRPRPTSLA